MPHHGVSYALFNVLRQRDVEGYSELIYLDGKGLPTVGVGMLLASEHEVQRFHWYSSGTHSPVNTDQVVTAWRPYAPPPGGASLPGHHSRRTIAPEFVTDEDSIREVFEQNVDSFENGRPPGPHGGGATEGLSQRFGRQEWMSFPADAQLGMFLHIWGFGLNSLNHGWSLYQTAIREHRWEDAGRESHWQGIRRPRAAPMDLAFYNAARVEEHRAAHRPVDHTVVIFPGRAAVLGPSAIEHPEEWVYRRS
jgi:hypothetical protein